MPQPLAGDAVPFESAARLTTALASREISSRELLALCASRADALNEQVNAVVTLDLDRAQEQARAADDALARGAQAGPLHGLPMTVKDSVETAGMRTTSRPRSARSPVRGRHGRARPARAQRGRPGPGLGRPRRSPSGARRSVAAGPAAGPGWVAGRLPRRGLAGRPYCPLAEDVSTVLYAAVQALRAAGARTDDRARPVDLGEAHRLYERLFAATSSVGVPEPAFVDMSEATRGPAGPGQPPALVRARASTLRHRDWLLLHEQRLQLAARWAAFFASYDVLLCPVTPTSAFLHDHSEPLEDRALLVDGSARSYLEQSVWNGLAGAAYLPAAVVPVGLTPTGLPVGMQVVAPHLEDRTAVDVARRVEQLVGGFQAPPLASR